MKVEVTVRARGEEIRVAFSKGAEPTVQPGRPRTETWYRSDGTSVGITEGMRSEG